MCVKYQSDLIILLVYIVKYHELTLEVIVCLGYHGFQYFSIVTVLHYLQVVLFLKS